MEHYEEPMLEMIPFISADVITVSPGEGDGESQKDMFG